MNHKSIIIAAPQGGYGKTTVLIATHDSEMVRRLGKRILHIENGRMA